jgi:hypothetical protein
MGGDTMLIRKGVRLYPLFSYFSTTAYAFNFFAVETIADEKL